MLYSKSLNSQSSIYFWLHLHLSFLLDQQWGREKLIAPDKTDRKTILCQGSLYSITRDGAKLYSIHDWIQGSF